MSFDLARALPFKSHFVRVASYKLHYFDEGPPDADVVLMLHGNPTWSFYFRKLIQALSGNYRVIAPDFIGCGLSDHPADIHFRAIERVEHLEQLLAALKIEKFSLVMHDWGGPIGSFLAVANPERIEKIVYMNTTLTETENLPGFIRVAASAAYGKFFTQTTALFIRAMLRFGVLQRVPKEIRRGYLFPYRSQAARTAIWGFVRDIPFDSNHPSYSDLQQLASRLPLLSKKPVLIVWGLRDPCFHRAMLRQVCRHFPEARVVEVPHASHLVLEDAPELVCREIGAFLEERERATPTADSTASPSNATSASTLYAGLRRWASECPLADAVITPNLGMGIDRWLSGGLAEALPYSKLSFEQLYSIVQQYERGLDDLGLQAEDRVVMLVPPGVEFMALAFAVMGRGAVPVFLDPGMGRKNLVRCIEDAAPSAFIGSPRAQLLKFFARRTFQRFRFRLTTAHYAPFGGTPLRVLKCFSNRPLEPRLLQPDSTALIAFTSGATGTPKGVVFSNSMLSAQLNVFAQTFGLTFGMRDLPLLPIFSLFSLPLGVCSVVPPINPSKPLQLDPVLLQKLIDDLQITTSFGSPTLWAKIAEFCMRRRATFPSLKRVFMAGAPVPRAVLERVKIIAPNAVVGTPYGATEALPVTMVTADSISSVADFRAEGGECGTFVGRPVPGVDLRIIEPSDEPIATIGAARTCPPGRIGEVIVRGANVSPKYLNRPDANKIAKIHDRGGFWHRMGDMGFVDSDGNLYFCGRKAHVVQTRDRIYYSDPVENVFNHHAWVRRTALIKLNRAPGVAVAVEPLPERMPHSARERQEFARSLAAIGVSSPVTRGITVFFFHPSFPVDARHNAKIFRDRLGEWACEHKELGAESEIVDSTTTSLSTPSPQGAES